MKEVAFIWGKTLLNYYLNDLLPSELQDKLETQFQLSRESVLEAIYRKGFPNRYLASMAPFVANNLSHPFIDEIVNSCFRSFFTINILPLLKNQSLPLCFGGSIAFHFEANLRTIAQEFGSRNQSNIDGAHGWLNCLSCQFNNYIGSTSTLIRTPENPSVFWSAAVLL